MNEPTKLSALAGAAAATEINSVRTKVETDILAIEDIAPFTSGAARCKNQPVTSTLVVCGA